MLKIFYDPRQTVARNNSFSPSAEKPAKVVESIKKLGIQHKMLLFKPVNREDLYRVHSREYVDGVMDLRRSNGFSNRLKEVADALTWVSGSMVAAAKCAYKENTITLSPTSGAHHAGYDFGGGFCTFNFIALAALKVMDMGAKKVGIVDMDNHYGNGTENIIKRLNLKNIVHYTYGGDNETFNTKDWLEKLPGKLREKFSCCDLIIFNAGADSHKDDPLGGVLSTKEMRLRDRIVFRELFENMNKGIVISLAGGYQKDAKGSIDKVLGLHNNTVLEADEFLRNKAGDTLVLKAE